MGKRVVGLWAAALGLAVLLLGTGGMGPAAAQPAYLGPKKCQDCHRAEHKVWKETKHFKSFRTVHKNKAAKGILKAAGGKGAVRRSKLCVVCHFTVGGRRTTPDEWPRPADSSTSTAAPTTPLPASLPAPNRNTASLPRLTMVWPHAAPAKSGVSVCRAVKKLLRF